MAAAGAPESLRGLLPSEQTMASWQSLEDARRWIGLKSVVLKEICGLLGDTELDHLGLFGATDPAVISRVLKEAYVPVPPAAEGDGFGEPRLLTTLERTSIALMYNASRAKHGLTMVDVLSEQAQPSAADHASVMAATVIAAATGGGMPNPLEMVTLSTTIDQAADGQVKILPPDRIAELARNYRAAMTTDPPDEQSYTDKQISALVRRVEAGLPPMWIWQYGGRTGIAWNATSSSV